jgi:hypothetical protein
VDQELRLPDECRRALLMEIVVAAASTSPFPAQSRRDTRGAARSSRRSIGWCENILALYAVVQDGSAGTTLPAFVRKELDGYVACGLLSLGFARVLCQTPGCGESRLVAFSPGDEHTLDSGDRDRYRSRMPGVRDLRGRRRSSKPILSRRAVAVHSLLDCPEGWSPPSLLDPGDAERRSIRARWSKDWGGAPDQVFIRVDRGEPIPLERYCHRLVFDETVIRRVRDDKLGEKLGRIVHALTTALKLLGKLHSTGAAVQSLGFSHAERSAWDFAEARGALRGHWFFGHLDPADCTWLEKLDRESVELESLVQQGEVVEDDRVFDDANPTGPGRLLYVRRPDGQLAYRDDALRFAPEVLLARLIGEFEATKRRWDISEAVVRETRGRARHSSHAGILVMEGLRAAGFEHHEIADILNLFGVVEAPGKARRSGEAAKKLFTEEIVRKRLDVSLRARRRRDDEATARVRESPVAQAMNRWVADERQRVLGLKGPVTVRIPARSEALAERRTHDREEAKRQRSLGLTGARHPLADRPNQPSKKR